VNLGNNPKMGYDKYHQLSYSFGRSIYGLIVYFHMKDPLVFMYDYS